jgi:hypothetical protein
MVRGVDDLVVREFLYVPPASTGFYNSLESARLRDTPKYDDNRNAQNLSSKPRVPRSSRGGRANIFRGLGTSKLAVRRDGG